MTDDTRYNCRKIQHHAAVEYVTRIVAHVQLHDHVGVFSGGLHHREDLAQYSCTYT